MKNNELFEITTALERTDEPAYGYMVTYNIRFLDDEFQKLAVYYAMSYKREVIVLKRATAFFMPGKFGTYTVDFTDPDNFSQRTKEIWENMKEIKTHDSMLDFILTGQWRVSFKNKVMAEEFQEKGILKMEKELRAIYDKARLRKDLHMPDRD